MNIIIYGATEQGCLIATEFFEDHDITIIDKEENFTNNFSKLDIGFVVGNASNVEVLKKANIKEADLFLACSESDEVNILSCLTAKRISGVRTVCFVGKEEYRTSLGLTKDSDFISDLYIDDIVWPEELLTQDIFRIITVSEALDVENFANGRARLLEYKIKENSVLVDKMVKECDFPRDTLIVGLAKENELLIPNGDTVFSTGDKAIFMGLSRSLDKLAGRFFHEKDMTKRVTVIGGGNVGGMLAESLEDAKIKTKIIEKDTSRCDELSQCLSSTLVLCGDGTDLNLLHEEDIASSDVVVSVTNNDEKNLLCSLLAKQLGVKRVISRVSKNANIPLFEKVGIDIALSDKTASLNEVKNSLSGGKADILATVEQGKGEIIEISLNDAKFNNIKVMDLHMPVKAVISIIQRRNKIIIPKGDTILRNGDTLIIFTASENAPMVKTFFSIV